MCITAIVLLAVSAATFGRAAGPDVPELHDAPVFVAGSPAADTLDTRTTVHTKRLYDSIQSKTSRRKFSRMLYNIVFVTPMRDTTSNGRVLDESRLLDPYAGKTIGTISIVRQDVFDPDGNWLERTGNKLHVITRERVIRRDLLFKPGQKLDPQLIVRNTQLLRSRSYISDADITVQPDPEDSTVVNLVVHTRDSWTISLDGALRSEGRTMVGISDNNILGTGNRLKLNTNFNRNDFSFGGEMAEYGIPNVLGSFFALDLAGGHDFYNETLSFRFYKEFLRTTDYELGVSYNDLRSKYYMIQADSERLVKVRNLDAWGGYSHYIPSIRSSAYVTARYNYERFSERPSVGPDFNPALHDHDVLLLGTGLYREKFYTANMVYGFGTREYIATGYKAELTGGYSWGEFADEIYMGLSCQSGGFTKAGYFMGAFSLGSYISPKNGMWRHSAVDVSLKWFSNLIVFRRNRIRQFLSLDYTQGWNRGAGSNEVIRFTSDNGLQALNQYIVGTNRGVLSTETVIFTPFQPLGFRFAFFGFADFGLIGFSPNIFKNDFFTTLGVGIRIKNERLIFSTIQLRLGVALGKNGVVASDYFRLSNPARFEQMRYRPSRPEIVGFQ